MISYFIVRGHSMEPLCREGDFCIGEKFSFLLSRPTVGQIVLLSHPLEKGLTLLKRIVKSKREEDTWLYWVEGDNVSASSDSRSFGWVPKQNIIGQARVIHRTVPLTPGILS